MGAYPWGSHQEGASAIDIAADRSRAESYNHYAVGWAHAMSTPSQWTKQAASHWGGTRNGTIVHWPKASRPLRPLLGRHRPIRRHQPIVSRYFAERMFPDELAVGKRVRSSSDENILREVVGVVDEVRYWGLAERERAPLVYVPYTQDPQFGLLIVARSRGSDASALPATVRRALSAVDPEMAIADLRPLAASAARSVANERYATLLLSVLAAVALSLSALGIYGVTSYVFTLRRRELGIRLALGASPRNLYGLVFRHGFVLTGAGLVVGLAGAAAFTRWLETLLFNTLPADSTAWLAMVAVVILSTAVACAVPARRAASASPTSALRAE